MALVPGWTIIYPPQDRGIPRALHFKSSFQQFNNYQCQVQLLPSLLALCVIRMSSSANPRSAPNNDRRTSATTAKPRASSSRTGAKGPFGSSGEIQPDDSASNAPHRRKASGRDKAHGSTRTTTERQTERVNITTKESTRLRVRSPVKASAGDDKGIWNSEVLRSPRLGSPDLRTVPSPKKKREEPPRRSWC